MTRRCCRMMGQEGLHIGTTLGAILWCPPPLNHPLFARHLRCLIFAGGGGAFKLSPVRCRVKREQLESLSCSKSRVHCFVHRFAREWPGCSPGHVVGCTLPSELPKGNIAKWQGLSITLSEGTALCPFDIACCAVFGLCTFGQFKKALCSPEPMSVSLSVLESRERFSPPISLTPVSDLTRCG